MGFCAFGFHVQGHCDCPSAQNFTPEFFFFFFKPEGLLSRSSGTKPLLDRFRNRGYKSRRFTHVYFLCTRWNTACRSPGFLESQNTCSRLFCAAWQKLHACGGDFTQIGNLQRDERKEKGEVNRQLLLCRSFGCSQVSHREGGEISFLLSKWIIYQNIYHFSLTNCPLNEDIDILYIELDFKIRFVKNYSPLPTIFLHSYQSDFHIIWHRSEILRPLEVYLQPNTCRIQ